MDPSLSDISLPDGFSIEVWTDEVPNARSLTLGESGTVFVSTRRDGRVYAVTQNDDDSPVVTTIAEGLRMPNGIAFKDGALFVAENHRIIRYDNIETSLESIPDPVVVIDTLPTERHHGWRYIDFGPDNKLYIALGAPCNVCEWEGSANISRMNPDGSGQEVFAEGVRNSVGFAWHPETGELWFTDNGRDMLGDDIPPGELNRAPEAGMHFGFPYCHGDNVSDPEFGNKRSCSEFEPPAQKLGAHVAPLGVIFYTGGMFPEEYRNQVLIAEHGSWNRSRKIGYRLSMVRMSNGEPTAYDVFAKGWLIDEEVSGRPVDLLQLEDGSILLSDDQNESIYRIIYSRPIDEGVSP
ncbi:MAG: PQQ-dependent sugar dehydrogenase [Woeseiaceae bacterium]|nr:PQQ-dependent sugar dehydrogenase [Woeseiaceae bacterium]